MESYQLTVTPGPGLGTPWVYSICKWPPVALVALLLYIHLLQVPSPRPYCTADRTAPCGQWVGTKENVRYGPARPTHTALCGCIAMASPSSVGRYAVTNDTGGSPTASSQRLWRAWTSMSIWQLAFLYFRALLLRAPLPAAAALTSTCTRM